MRIAPPALVPRALVLLDHEGVVIDVSVPSLTAYTTSSSRKAHLARVSAYSALVLIERKDMMRFCDAGFDLNSSAALEVCCGGSSLRTEHRSASRQMFAQHCNFASTRFTASASCVCVSHPIEQTVQRLKSVRRRPEQLRLLYPWLGRLPLSTKDTSTPNISTAVSELEVLKHKHWPRSHSTCPRAKIANALDTLRWR